MAEATQADMRRLAGAVMLVAGAAALFGMAGIQSFGLLQIFSVASGMVLVVVAFYRLRPFVTGPGRDS